MRLVFRILGTDVFEFSTEPDPERPTPGSGFSADLAAAPPPFGFNPNDEPLVDDE